MISHGKDMKVFTGNANPGLAKDICNLIGIQLGHSEIGHFADGEVSASIYESVRGSDVFIGCNTNLVPPVNVGKGAYIAAGTTVTKDVEEDALAIGRVRQENKSGWAKAKRELEKGRKKK